MQTDTVSAPDEKRGANAAATTLYVCLTCKKVPGLEAAPDADAASGNAAEANKPAEEVLPGQRLFDALERAKAANAVEGDVEIVGVYCLSNCKRSCTIALASEGRWTYVYGDMHPEESVDDILSGARLYAASSDGIVPWRERPVIFRKNVIARIPSLRQIIAP